MGAIFSITNLINLSTLDSVSTEDTLYVKENLYNQRPSKPMRFTAKTAQWIKANLGAAHKVTLAAVFNHNLLSGATVALQAAASDVWSLPPDLIVNGGFDSSATGWSSGTGSLASVAGGVSGNCLQITRVSGVNQPATQDVAGLTIGQSYIFTAYIKSGTSGNEAAGIAVWRTSDWSSPASNYSITSSGVWIAYSLTFTATATTHRFELRKNTATAGTMLFDSASLRAVAPATPYSSAVTWREHDMAKLLDQTYQWWRLTVDDASNPAMPEIGEFFLGEYESFTNAYLQPGFQVTPVFHRSKNVTPMGQIWSRGYAEGDEFELVFQRINTTADVDTIRDFLSRVHQNDGRFVVMPEDGLAHVYYVFLDSAEAANIVRGPVNELNEWRFKVVTLARGVALL